MDLEESGFVFGTSRPAAPYVNRPPSPPHIHVPSVTAEGISAMQISPSFDNVEDTLLLTKEDLSIITQNKPQVAREDSKPWEYKLRRTAQPILEDWLYLGPSNVAKDTAFLMKEGITMLLGARDARMAEARLMSVEKTAKELNLETAYIDVAGIQDLSKNFDAAVRKINDHLLRVYRSQAVQHPQADSQPQEGQIVIDTANFKRGKVLVYCETGNDRSAAVVAAYIMSVFGMDLVPTLQFIGLQRFCTNFDDETKNWLNSYAGILHARRSVAMAHQEDENAMGSRGHVPPMPSRKRDLVDMMGQDENGITDGDPAHDRDRYLNRDPFVPFLEDPDVSMGGN